MKKSLVVVDLERVKVKGEEKKEKCHMTIREEMVKKVVQDLAIISRQDNLCAYSSFTVFLEY